MVLVFLLCPVLRCLCVLLLPLIVLCPFFRELFLVVYCPNSLRLTQVKRGLCGCSLDHFPLIAGPDVLLCVAAYEPSPI